MAPERNRKRCILVLTAKTAVQDFEVVSTLDDTYKNGIFKLDVNVTNHTAANKNVTVTYELLDADKKVVTSAETPCSVSADGKNTVTFNASLNNVKTWTSEQPNLYKLLISFKRRWKNNRSYSVQCRLPSL